MFSKICIYRYCSLGLVKLAMGELGGKVVDGATAASGELGDRCEV